MFIRGKGQVKLNHVGLILITSVAALEYRCMQSTEIISKCARHSIFLHVTVLL